MKLTPQACRLITDGVRVLPDREARNRWHDWLARSAAADLPHDATVIALDALGAAAHERETRIELNAPDEDSKADILNDLGYVQAIEEGLRREGVDR